MFRSGGRRLSDSDRSRSDSAIVGLRADPRAIFMTTRVEGAGEGRRGWPVGAEWHVWLHSVMHLLGAIS